MRLAVPFDAPRANPFAAALALFVASLGGAPASMAAQGTVSDAQYHDAHFHLTNYIQEGIDVPTLLGLMGTRVGRSTLFGIPLQQTWSYANSGNYAPTYYLQSDAPLYYYSFADAFIAMAYRALPAADQARFDPMIIGFNPADMYAAEHIRRVLTTFPGVFSGIGEFSIHKEFVSAKVAGEVASLTNPALDSILSFSGEVGLVVLLHNDLDVPFARVGSEPVYFSQVVDLFGRHRETTIVWAHVGLGRVVRPVQASAAAPATERNPNHAVLVERILSDPSLAHVHFDLSWDEVAKYIVADPDVLRRSAEVINRYPDRFLFGSDVVAPRDEAAYYSVYEMYAPLWELLTPDTREAVLKGNYVRLFDEARRRVRAWESANVR